MKWFWKYLFPALYGLLIYFTIRLINDTLSYDPFWDRSWKLNAFEMFCSVVMAYIMVYALQRLFRYFDRSLATGVGYKTVLHELLWVFIVTEVSVNLLMTPMAALTDDGLSIGDAAIINVIPVMYNLIYYTVVRANKLLKAYIDKQMQLEKITNDQLQTELKFLKAQYHPHFLFNALNTVYFQMDDDIQAAKRSIEKFSGLLRYQLYDQQQTVPLSQEIQYLQNFIELQQVRTSDKLQLNVHFDSGLNGQQIYPLLLLPLVENAFKYVGGRYQLRIDARLVHDKLVFAVENNVPEHIPVKVDSGIGLENLKRRLELLYAGKSTLTTAKKGDVFHAELHINLER
ncbi:sensor histidine kinase [Paraflavitalea pollutisoli]|uniref:sensor histidine kinase n=1 Tax=Paraflavitalea pollutisoli TaxID=3034143 RepID=UPI0023EE1811|nr:histidine kinase [Paraflavitalea sp. H1-2-19X]